MLSAGIVAVVAAVGDMASQSKSWEDITFKAALGIALIFVTHQLLKEQAERKADWAAHKAEMKAMMEAHQRSGDEREVKAQVALTANTDALREIVASNKEQTEFFKGVTRGLVEERIKKPALP